MVAAAQETRGFAVPRSVASVSLALVVLLGLVATTGRSTTAQEAFATPGPGEFFVWPPYMEGEVRNDGQETAVTLLANLAPEEAAGPPMAGTPTS